MRQRTHYEVLGVPPDAPLSQIKAAFRELAKRYHPDLNPGMEGVRFRQILNAYDVLSDSIRRRAYDREIQRSASPTRPAD